LKELEELNMKPDSHKRRGLVNQLNVDCTCVFGVGKTRGKKKELSKKKVVTVLVDKRELKLLRRECWQ